MSGCVLSVKFVKHANLLLFDWQLTFKIRSGLLVAFPLNSRLCGEEECRDFGSVSSVGLTFSKKELLKFSVPLLVVS